MNQPWPKWLAKKPPPPGACMFESSLKCATAGWKIHEIARNVSGIIDSSASAVAKNVPKRRPR